MPGAFCTEVSCVVLLPVPEENSSLSFMSHASTVEEADVEPMIADLKPENLLLKSRDAPIDKDNLRAVDFGLSTFFQDGQTCKEVVGCASVVSGQMGTAPVVMAPVDAAASSCTVLRPQRLLCH